MYRVNVHIYPTPFKYESRILKITKTIKEAKVFNRIYILATWESGLPEKESLDETREVIRVRRKLGQTKTSAFWKALKTLEWSWRLMNVLRHKKVDCINCHSLPALPLCAFLKLFKRAKLIYDTHELETEMAGSTGIRKFLSQIVERILILSVDETIVVSESISKWYKEKYNLKKVNVIRNVPYRQNGKIEHSYILKEEFSINDDELLFIFQGSLSEGRGIEMLLDVFAKVDRKKHIVFMGNGVLENVVKEYENKFSNIHHHPNVKPEKITSYTKSADVGICLTENTCLNHLYSLPNKIFEYILSGLPIIVSDFPDMGKIVDEHKCGWKVPVEKNAIKEVINTITQDIIYEKRKKAQCAMEHFGWHLEEPVLLSVYRKLGF